MEIKTQTQEEHLRELLREEGLDQATLQGAVATVRDSAQLQAVLERIHLLLDGISPAVSHHQKPDAYGSMCDARQLLRELLFPRSAIAP